MKKINTEELDNFFSFVSKAIIIIPIIIVIISLFLKFNTVKIPLNINYSITPSPIAQLTQNNSFKFDFKGPIVCDNLFIKDKKVLYKDKTTNYLLNGDCLYIWEEGKNNGEKKCGLSNYISMAENYLGFLDVKDLTNNNLIKNIIKDKNIDLMSVVKSCKRKEIKDDSIFEVPEKILFINKK